MEIQELMRDIKSGEYKAYYIFINNNKYVVDRYLEIICKGDYKIQDFNTCINNLMYDNLFAPDGVWVVRAENDGEIKELIKFSNTKHLIILYDKKYNDKNTVYFAPEMGSTEIDKFCEKNKISKPKNLDKYDLHKIMMELSKIPILNERGVKYDFNKDILHIDEFKQSDLDIYKLSFNDSIPDIYSVMNNLIKMIQIADNKGKSMEAIKKTTGIENEKLIWLFQKYCTLSVETYIRLYNKVYKLYRKSMQGFPEEMIGKTILYYFIQERKFLQERSARSA